MSRMFVLRLSLENEAFSPNAEVEIARILQDVAEKITSHNINPDRSNIPNIIIFDDNGNRAGYWSVLKE